MLDLQSNIVDFAVANGMLMKSNKEYTNLSFTIFPTPVPKNEFLEIKTLQPSINKLVYLISKDAGFLSNALRSVVETDEFTRNLFEIYKKVLSIETKPVCDICVLRADYMFDYSAKTSTYSPKQIEINTIASSFGGVGGNILRSVHCKALKESSRKSDITLVPENPSQTEIAKGLAEGWKAYGQSSAIIIFLVYSNEVNIFDQRALEYGIYIFDENIIVKRKSFEDIIANGRVEADGRFFIENDEVAVVYFRSGYRPEDYPTPQHWNARLLIEKSKVVKCPNVALQLVGCKKIQEVLARPGVVEKFIKDSVVASVIRKTFAGFYTLDMNEEGNKSVKMALLNPENFVMKPQREGGGNNYYGKSIAKHLENVGSRPERSAYVLMDRIRPRTHRNLIVVKGKVSEVELISELGVFGVFLAKNDELVLNYTAGHLLRSKPKEFDEGGIAAGFAVLDSPLLV